MAANGTLNDGSESQSFSSGETGGDFFDFDSIGAEEAIPTQREYFSYEDAVAGEEVRPVEKVMQEEPAQVLRPAFDLRQAVIYQTLLNNQYITGLGK